MECIAAIVFEHLVYKANVLQNCKPEKAKLFYRAKLSVANGM